MAHRDLHVLYVHGEGESDGRLQQACGNDKYGANQKRVEHRAALQGADSAWKTHILQTLQSPVREQSHELGNKGSVLQLLLADKRQVELQGKVLNFCSLVYTSFY